MYFVLWNIQIRNYIEFVWRNVLSHFLEVVREEELYFKEDFVFFYLVVILVIF